MDPRFSKKKIANLGTDIFPSVASWSLRIITHDNRQEKLVRRQDFIHGLGERQRVALYFRQDCLARMTCRSDLL